MDTHHNYLTLLSFLSNKVVMIMSEELPELQQFRHQHLLRYAFRAWEDEIAQEKRFQ